MGLKMHNTVFINNNYIVAASDFPKKYGAKSPYANTKADIIELTGAF